MHIMCIYCNSTYVDTNVRMSVYYTDCNVCECIGMYRYIHMYHMIVCKICMSICMYIYYYSINIRTYVICTVLVRVFVKVVIQLLVTWLGFMEGCSGFMTRFLPLVCTR